MILEIKVKKVLQYKLKKCFRKKIGKIFSKFRYKKGRIEKSFRNFKKGRFTQISKIVKKRVKNVKLKKKILYLFVINITFQAGDIC